MDETEFSKARERMVARQIIARGIRSPGVLEAMRAIPRHAFIPPEHRPRAYEDNALPIGHWQTISQPYIVALMTQLLALNGSEKVLEIGTGSGYQAAILSRLARQVHTIERIPELADLATRTLISLGFDNVHVHTGDGSLGLLQYAPFERIIVTAGAPAAPSRLLEQLQDGGRMVIPVGERGEQRLEVWERTGRGYDAEPVLPVAFVPLVGEQGWKTEWYDEE